MYKMGLEKVEESKIFCFLFIDSKKVYDFVDHTSCGTFLKRWEYQTTLPASWEICMQFKKKQLEVDMEQQITKLWKEYIKAAYCHPTYLTYMQSTSWETLAG